MTAYADAIAKPPRTLTDLEQKLILKTTGEHRDGYRDHVIISLALGTGLREHELLALDCGDVFDDDGRARRKVTLRVFKRSADEKSYCPAGPTRPFRLGAQRALRGAPTPASVAGPASPEFEADFASPNLVQTFSYEDGDYDR